MDSLAIIQPMKIMKTYYKNGDSATATYRALSGDYGSHNHPTAQAMGKIIKNFKRLKWLQILKALKIPFSRKDRYCKWKFLRN